MFVWLIARTAGISQVEEPDLRSESRVLLLGDPGTGKTTTLLQEAAEAEHPALYLRLGSVRPPDALEDPEAVFVTWMDKACAENDTTERLTHDRLRTWSYEFYLDGLDEVPPSQRAAVSRLIASIADRYPQHRWVVSSRSLLGDQIGDLAGFYQAKLIPTRSWLERFLAQHGRNLADLEPLETVTSALGELLQIPLFATAAITLLELNDDVPSSAHELLLALADSGLAEEETRLPFDRPRVSAWLDDVALLALIRGDDSLALEQVAPLDPALADPNTLDTLVSRTLLADPSDRVRFITRPLRDARAARALINHPNRAALLEEFGSAEAGGSRHLRPTWRFAIDLLLTAETETLRPELTTLDPLLACRVPVKKVSESARSEALRTMWQWYCAHEIHLPRDVTGELDDDLAAARSLLQEGVEASVITEIAEGLHSSVASTRGNALVLLAAAGEEQTVADVVEELLADESPVVRRRTAHAVGELDLHDFAQLMAARALEDDNDLARRTLAQYAILVARKDDIRDLVLKLEGDVRLEVRAAIDERLTRDEQLDLLASLATVRGDWLEHLCESDEDWTASQVEELGKLLARVSWNRPHENVLARLRENPFAALTGRLQSPVDRRDEWDLRRIVDALDDDEVAALTATANLDDSAREYLLRARPPQGADE